MLEDLGTDTQGLVEGGNAATTAVSQVRLCAGHRAQGPSVPHLIRQSSGKEVSPAPPPRTPYPALEGSMRVG